MKTAYVIFAAVLVVGGIGVWFMTQKNSESQTSVSASSQMQKARGSLAELVAKGGAWKCTVSQSAEGAATTGDVYVSAGKIRGTFNSTVPNVGKVTSNMIADGEYVYVWSSMMPSGMKMKQSDSNTNDTPDHQHEDFYNQSYDYSCEPWTSDASIFVLPANVSFSEMNTSIPAAGSAGASGAGELSCAMCDQAPTAEAKTACRSALKCK